MHSFSGQLTFRRALSKKLVRPAACATCGACACRCWTLPLQQDMPDPLPFSQPACLLNSESLSLLPTGCFSVRADACTAPCASPFYTRGSIVAPAVSQLKVFYDLLTSERNGEQSWVEIVVKLVSIRGNRRERGGEGGGE